MRKLATACESNRFPENSFFGDSLSPFELWPTLTMLRRFYPQIDKVAKSARRREKIYNARIEINEKFSS
jgi:hypothetical protein